MVFHHIGFVVPNLETFAANMLHSGLVADVYDPVQNARLALYRNFDGSFLELIQPDENAFTFNHLKSGNPFHHVCYRVNSTEEMKAHAEEKGYLLFKGPLKAILFGGSEVYFYFTRNRTVVEFLIQPE